MDRAYAAGAVSNPPAFPLNATLGYPADATQGVTRPGAWWLHMVTEEIRNAIVSGGLTPDKSKVNQLSQAIATLATNKVNADLVANGVPSFSSTNTWTAANRQVVKAVSFAASLVLDLNQSNNFAFSLTGNCTLATPSNLNVAPGQTGFIAITQGASLGNLSFSSVWKFADNVTPTNTKVNGAIDLLVYHVVDVSRIQVIYYNNVK